MRVQSAVSRGGRACVAGLPAMIRPRLAMECSGSEPAQAARELVVRDRSPNDGESPPSAGVRSKFRQRLTSAGLVSQMWACGGARDPERDADREAGVEA